MDFKKSIQVTLIVGGLTVDGSFVAEDKIKSIIDIPFVGKYTLIKGSGSWNGVEEPAYVFTMIFQNHIEKELRLLNALVKDINTHLSQECTLVIVQEVKSCFFSERWY